MSFMAADKTKMTCSCGFSVLEDNKEIINLKDYLTASGKYLNRETHKELTDEYKDNAIELLNKVNKLLQELNISKVEISSGFRPSEVNAGIPNAAKKSLHMTCKAVDILDNKEQDLGKLILENSNLLTKYGLWLEDLDHTKGWVHLDNGTRRDRPVRVFKP